MGKITKAKLKILAALGENIFRTTKPFRYLQRSLINVRECCNNRILFVAQVYDAKSEPLVVPSLSHMQAQSSHASSATHPIWQWTKFLDQEKDNVAAWQA